LIKSYSKEKNDISYAEALEVDKNKREKKYK